MKNQKNLEKELRVMYDFTLEFVTHNKSGEIFQMMYNLVQDNSGLSKDEFRYQWLQYQTIKRSENEAYGDVPRLPALLLRQAE